MALPGPRCPDPPAILGSARQLTDSALRQAIATLDPTIAHMSEYHLGWRDAAGQPTGSTGTGRGVCLALPLLSARTVGAPADVAVAGAVALELVHVFTHVHDDIMDRDAVRRHRPSLWQAFGLGPAILTGDTLFALAMRVIVSASRPSATAAATCLLDACLDLSTGQALDLTFEHSPIFGPNAVGVDEYIAMARGKTGALYGCGLSIGAVLASTDSDAVSALHAAGRELGIVAQIADDINGIWGDPQVTGKPVLGDLRRRKKSLPVLAVLAAEDPTRSRFAELWSEPTSSALTAEHTSSDQAEQAEHAMLRILDDAHARAFCEAHADSHHDAALTHLGRVDMPSDVRAELNDLALFIRHRRG